MKGATWNVTYSSVTSLGIPLGITRSPLLLQRTTESMQVHWEGQGGESKQLLSSLPAEEKWDAQKGNQLSTQPDALWQQILTRSSEEHPWIQADHHRILKLLIGSTYKFFRQQEQQLKNGMAAFLNKYITYIFSPKQYLLLCNLSNTVKSVMWILNPSPVPRMDMVKWITCCPQTHLDRWHSRSTLFKEDFSINSIFRR